MTAALKCRQRKKIWLQNLQAKLEYLTTNNEQLQLETQALRGELIRLKTLLLAHKSCSLNPQAIMEAIQRPIPSTTTTTQPASTLIHTRSASSFVEIPATSATTTTTIPYRHYSAPSIAKPL